MGSSESPLVSIITVHFNSGEVTRELLHSVFEINTYPNIEVIVVDNASDIEIAQSLKDIFPKVKFIRNKDNLGFAGGNNVGWKAASGEYLFFVNNDTEFTQDLIEGLLDVYNLRPDVGLVSPKFQYFYQKGIIEYAGYQPVSVITGRNRMIGCKEVDKGQYDTFCETAYPHGGAMMISRKVIEEVGGLPEVYFLYYEEFDWAEQVKAQGYSVYYQPKSLIYHKESMSTGKMSPLKTYYLSRNRILFMRRNMSHVNFGLFLIYLIFITIPKNSVQFIFRGQREHLRSFWKGLHWHLEHKIS